MRLTNIRKIFQAVMLDRLVSAFVFHGPIHISTRWHDWLI